MHKPLEWEEFVAWVQGRAVSKTTNEGDRVILSFTDKSKATIISNYDGPYSDLTPGEGPMCPTVVVEE